MKTRSSVGKLKGILIFATIAAIATVVVAGMDLRAPVRMTVTAGSGSYTNILGVKVGIASIFLSASTAFATNDVTTIRVWDPKTSNSFILAQTDALHPATNTLAFIDNAGGVGIENLGKIEITSTYTNPIYMLMYNFNQ